MTTLNTWLCDYHTLFRPIYFHESCVEYIPISYQHVFVWDGCDFFFCLVCNRTRFQLFSSSFSTRNEYKSQWGPDGAKDFRDDRRGSHHAAVPVLWILNPGHRIFWEGWSSGVMRYTSLSLSRIRFAIILTTTLCHACTLNIRRWRRCWFWMYHPFH